MTSPAHPADALTAAADAPPRVDELFAQANAAQTQGRLDDAEATCRALLALDEGNAAAWHLRGIVAFRAGNPATALAHFERAAALAPQKADIRNSLGFALRALRREKEAEAAFRESIALDPSFLEAHYQLGNLLREAKRNADAEASYRRVLALNPEHAQAHNNLGAALGEQRRFEEAADHFRRAAELRPGYAEAHSNLAHALRAVGRAEEAEAASRQAIAFAPRLAVAHVNLGLALQDIGRMDEALASFRRASALDPDYQMAIACEGMLHLLRGNFAAGWEKYEARWKIGDLPPREFAQPQWRGEPLDGRTILLHAEQGFGDTIQFLRYLPLVVARGGKVVLEIQKPLIPLVTRSASVEIIARGDPLPSFDVHCPLLSLPLAFGTTLQTIPAAVPYVAAPPERVAHWRARLGEGELKVGVAWAGSPIHRNDRHRSIPVEKLKPLFEFAGARFFSLQVGARSADLAAVEPVPVTDLSGELTDFGETAAALANLDLIISADTAIVHLAGALGKPVWTMLPFAPDWRWLTARSDSPWYPSMRLFRQPRHGDWDGVVAAVRQALADRSAGAPQLPDRARRAEYVALVAAANEHHAAQRHAECEAALRRALAIDPTNASAWHVLALTRHALDDKPEAIDLMQKAVALEPRSANFMRDLGIMLHSARRFEEALEIARRAAELNPEDPANHNAVGATCSELGRSADAIEAFRRAIELKPDYHEAWANMAHSQQALLKLDEAADSYRRALGIRHDYVEGHVSSAMLALLRGDFLNGFTEFEWRWRLKIMTPRDFKQPVWQGEPLNGKTILLHAEQGYGDTLQCLRFVPEVAARGGRLLLELPPPLTQLATTLPAGGEIVLQGRTLPNFDVHCAFMSLPRVLGVTLDDLKDRPVPYLRADPAAVERWARRLAGTGSGLRVGIAWAGNPKHAADSRRSIAVERLADLMRADGVRFYSLQVGERAKDLALLPAGKVLDLSPELTNFAETAAVLANLDLLVTVDTALAHLAGAIGRPCWVMLPFSPDWRWLTERGDSPWYPSLRLFRQASPAAWDEVIARVGAALAERAASRRPSGPEIDAREVFKQAMALQQTGRNGEAETIARRILASEPDYRPAINLLGVLRNAAGDAKEAADLFARLAELAPDDAEAHYNLAVVIGTLERYDEAITHYQRAIALNPNHAKAYSNLGSALRLRGRLDEAEAACRRALEIDPGNASALINLGTVFTSREQLDEAVQSFRRATALNPTLAEGFLNLGLALHNQGRFEEALTQYRRATGIRPDYADAHMGEAFALLTLGRDFRAALEKLEWRWRLVDRKPRGFVQPLWRGEPLQGRTILLHAEQGFGDSLMLLRYAPAVAARGGRVVIEVPKALVRLARSLGGGAFAVIAEGTPLPAFDLHCPLMSLPLALGTTPESIPGRVPYLVPTAEDVRRWKERLGDAPGLKVGIAWAGNPHHRNDQRRSIPLERFAALFDVPGVRWFSLQVGARAGDLATLPPGRINDLSPQLTDFAETAAAVANLDLVISADTAPAHLAGALGRPVWILLPFSPDWRWFAERADSPWYPTARLFRQGKPGDWESAIEAARNALGARVAAGAPAAPRAAEPPMLDRRYFAAVELIEAGRDAEASAALKSILDEDPRHAASLRRMAWLCHKRGDNSEAARMLAASLEREPNNPEAHYNFGLVLASLGRNKEAEQNYRRGLELKPNSVDGHNNLGVLLESLGRYDEAEASYRQAIAIAPTVPHPRNNLGVLFKESGRLAEALAEHRRVVALDPRLPAGRSNLLYTLNYDETVSPDAIYAEHVAWGGTMRFPIGGSRFAHSLDPARRLRIGYVSGDFRHHSVSFFFAPLLDAHDRGAVEVFLYSTDARTDATTERLKSRADHWVPIHHLSDEQAAARIRDDAVDILVDLSGHTSHNRMTLFARKPAPLAVTWLGYPNTTGLPAIDYRFTDAVADPPGAADRLHTERLVRLAPIFLCYGAPQDAGPVVPLPALAAGHVTFGSFNNIAKLSPSTVALWARLLREIPDARLLLKASQLKDRSTRERIAAAFAAAGVAGERITVLPPHAATADHLAAYGQVDIALDPLPYNGTATTCEALWMGVPVVTLRGERHAARVGASILTAIGLDNLIADTPDGYVTIAASLARDITALAALRQGLRERMRASPLCDGAGFARAVEGAYRTMWQDWCTAESAAVAGAKNHAVLAAGLMAPEAAEAMAHRLFDAKKLDEAEDVLRNLLEREPQRALAWFQLGRIRHLRGDNDAAMDFLRKAIAFDPRLAPAHNDLGIMLQGQGRLNEAEACYRRAIELNGRFAEAMSNLGAVLAARGRIDDATAWYGHALEVDAQFAPAHNNFGAVLARLERFNEAEMAHRRAIALKPDLPDGHYNLGVALQDQGRFEEALASYDKAITLKSDLVDARWNRAYVLLMLGRYADGWREHEWRWRRKEQPPRSYPQRLWRGEPLEGRTILLHAEQGMGDSVQFMRYVPLVAARGAKVILQVPPPLLRLVQASLGHCAQVQSDNDVLPAFDLHSPLLSLPFAFGTTVESIPAGVPYIKVEATAAARWRERLAGAKDLKVGLVWAGSPQHKNDRNRSIAIERLAPLFGAAGVRWFSLQVGERKSDLARVSAGTVTDLSDELTDFAETAAAIANLDLVIAVDTATAHIAGALGKPVWILVPFIPDWRWLVEREDTPFYPSARLFRQPARGDWDSVALRVRAALDALTGATPKPPAEAAGLLAEAQAKLDSGDVPAAETALKAALAADPMHARAWHRLATLAQGRAAHAEAAGYFRRAIALDPNAADVHNNLGISLGALGRQDEAIACYRRAIALRPEYAKACLNLGAALMDTNALEEAADYLGRAAALDPKLPEAHYNLGNLAEKRGDLADAADHFRRAAALRPGFYEAHNNLGAVLLKSGDPEAARESFAQALALKPNEPEAHHNLSNALAELDRYEEALASCRRAIALDPAHAHANFSEAMLLLAQGKLREGFEKYEWRWKLGTLVPRGFPPPLWNGEDLAGRTILLHGEQGYGDTIQGLRYAPMVAARGARVVLEVPQPLLRLAASASGVAELVTAGQTLPRFDLVCPLLSLPRAFATTLETIPAKVPYLAAPAEALAPWRDRLDGPGFKVGLAWAGSKLHRSDAQRSIAIETLAPLLQIEGVRWFSLQVGERADDLARLPEGLVTDLAPQLTDFAETAAAIAHLDLVITVDTAVAHVAGALARPAWVLLRARPDWRWLLEREDSPWYPSLRLFRQRDRGDWDEVVARVRTALQELVTSAPPSR